MSYFLHIRQHILHSNRDGFGSATIKCTKYKHFFVIKSKNDRQFINIPLVLEMVSVRNRFFPNSESVVVFLRNFGKKWQKMSFLLLPDVLTIEKQRQQKRLTKLMHFRLRTVFLFLQVKWRETRETPSVTRALLDGFRKKKECVLSKCI